MNKWQRFSYKRTNLVQFIFFSGRSFKAILFDVDSKDSTVGMSCPPVQFLEQEVLNTVQSCIRENGIIKLSSNQFIFKFFLKNISFYPYIVARHICSEFGVQRRKIARPSVN